MTIQLIRGISILYYTKEVYADVGHLRMAYNRTVNAKTVWINLYKLEVF